MGLAREPDRPGSVAGLPHDLEASAEAQRGAQEPTYVDHVVDQQHAEGHGHRPTIESSAGADARGSRITNSPAGEPGGPGSYRRVPALRACQLAHDEQAEAGAARGQAGGEPAEQPGLHGCGHPGARVADPDVQRARLGRRHRHVHGRGTVSHRVAEQVLQCLGQSVPIRDHRRPRGDRHEDLGGRVRALHDCDGLIEDVADLHRLRAHLERAGLQPRGRQQVARAAGAAGPCCSTIPSTSSARSSVGRARPGAGTGSPPSRRAPRWACAARGRSRPGTAPGRRRPAGAAR